MKKGAIFGIVLGLIFVCSTCENPTIPVPAGKDADKAATITVQSSKGTYLIGESATFTATLKKTDGSTVPITDGTWRSEFPDVATVDGAGLVKAVGEGYIYVACDYQGLSGQKNILVRGDYRGSWAGTYRIESCHFSGDFNTANFRATQAGSGHPIEFHLEMDGDDWLKGAIRLGELSTSLVDRPELDMAPILEGHVLSAPYTITVYITPEWTDSGPRFTRMLLAYAADGMKGWARVECVIDSLTKIGD